MDRRDYLRVVGGGGTASLASGLAAGDRGESAPSPAAGTLTLATATIEDLFADPDGDQVFVRWYVTATHDGAFAGIESRGNSLSYEE